MTEKIQNTLGEEAESSEFIMDIPSGEAIGFATFATDRFTTPRLLYTSPTGVMELYTASRYGKRFILKAIGKDYREDPVTEMVHRKEFEIGISLDHPNIRRTVGYESVEGLGNVIVMEYVDGETLGEALLHGHINGENARAVAAELADALCYLHARQTVHRDLKPANIMVTYSGQTVKLIDFSLSDSETFIVIKTPAGNRKYLAPEQLQPEAKPSVKADIYSFGLIVQELAVPGNDKELKELGCRCAAADPECRPSSLASVRIPSQADYRPTLPWYHIESLRFTLVLALLAAVLTLLIVVKLFI